MEIFSYTEKDLKQIVEYNKIIKKFFDRVNNMDVITRYYLILNSKDYEGDVDVSHA